MRMLLVLVPSADGRTSSARVTARMPRPIPRQRAPGGGARARPASVCAAASADSCLLLLAVRRQIAWHQLGCAKQCDPLAFAPAAPAFPKDPRDRKRQARKTAEVGALA